LLYCGDFGPTGEDIPRASETNTGLALEPVALTSTQVAAVVVPARVPALDREFVLGPMCGVERPSVAATD
jgi:hypothetical protein